MADTQYEFLDVGMGDSTLVIIGDTPATQELVLIDFGVQPFTKFKIGADDAMIYLVKTIDEISSARQEDLPLIDHLFLTHPDQDHYNRILDLITANYPSYPGEQLSIGKLTYGGPKGSYGGNLIDKIALRLVDKSTIPLPNKCHSTINGDGSVVPFATFGGGDVKVYLLSANYKTASAKPPNRVSICLLFEDTDSNKVILMGDAEKDVEAHIIKTFEDASDGFLNAYGLKLGHHGSRAGTSQEWIDAVEPDAIFATGDMVWAHPYCETIKRVIDSNVLGTMDEHWYCCGIPSKEYFDNKTKVQVCLNLWYVVKDKDGESMVDHDGTVEIGDLGVTYGVQWELEFTGAGNRQISHTDTSEPV